MDYSLVSMLELIPEKVVVLAEKERSTSGRAAGGKVRLKGTAFPTEHGSWGMVFEPLVASLAVAFSAGGLWIAMAFVGAFLMRQPLRVLIAERAARRPLPQGAVARRYFYIYAAVFLAGALGAVVFAGWGSFLPLILAAPLAVVQVYYDSARQSRRLAPEIAGAVAISSSAAIVALAAGWGVVSAAALWVILVCRSVPSILYVRERLLLEKRKQFSYFSPVIFSAAAVLATAALAIYGLSPWLVVFMMAVLFCRAAIGLSRFSRRRTAMRIGVFEVLFGALTVLAIVIGYYLHL